MVAKAEPKAQMMLPPTVISRSDVGQLLRELESATEFLAQAAIREPGQTMKLPRASRLLEEVATLNGLNLLQSEDQKQLRSYLDGIKQHAPELHMSFATNPSPTFMQKLMSWLRKEISPQVLVNVGLQPTIAAGCVVRTPNHYFDFSLRKTMLQKKDLLATKIEALTQP
jgi:F0F1-type ATP synthase delta subunit